MSAETDAAAQAPAESVTTESPLGDKLTGSTVAAVTAPPTDPKVDPAMRPRDVPVSTVVRLMGLPTAADLVVLESKIDILTTKVATVGARVERVASQLMEVFHDFDRFDVQIADLREFLKQSLGSIVGKVDSIKESGSGSANGGAGSTPKSN